MRFKEFIAVMFIVAMTVICMMYESQYTRQAVVTDVHEYEVTVEDDCGYIWIFEGSIFSPGDKVTLYMNSMGSIDYIEDDVIERVEIRK